MAATSEVVHCYAQLASNLSLMVSLARAKEWDRLPELEAQCASVLERLSVVSPQETLGVAQIAEARRLLERIRADQQAVSELVKPQLAHLVAAMADLQKRSELDRAYGLSR
ncbi:flagellar protein FliT [Variovorax sp. PBL-H6]|uniref:flagellar protein FliT n=1 Tax=Variovorax sp. PBL-H6 TaxID=434009 RepID=UPI001E479856|nr:flagellar protein FliT [Variovorax sp. PBL-H6]